MLKTYDIIIAGAGVNGLACACMLAKEGLSVCVVERNPWVGGGISAMGTITARVMLDDMGIKAAEF